MNPHLDGQVQQLLAEHPRIAEQGIRVIHTEDGVVLVGEVESPERCAQIESVIHAAFPDLTVRCDLAVTRVQPPEEVERI